MNPWSNRWGTIPQSPGPKPGAIPISLLLDNKREPTTEGLERPFSTCAAVLAY